MRLFFWAAFDQSTAETGTNFWKTPLSGRNPRGSPPDVDRLTRSLADFAKLVELFDAQGVSVVSVTQQFNTTTSMGRLTLNVLLSAARQSR